MSASLFFRCIRGKERTIAKYLQVPALVPFFSVNMLPKVLQGNASRKHAGQWLHIHERYPWIQSSCRTRNTNPELPPTHGPVVGPPRTPVRCPVIVVASSIQPSRYSTLQLVYFLYQLPSRPRLCSVEISNVLVIVDGPPRSLRNVRLQGFCGHVLPPEPGSPTNHTLLGSR